MHVLKRQSAIDVLRSYFGHDAQNFTILAEDFYGPLIEVEKDMKTRPEISQEIFNEMLDEAIEDLCKSGLSKKEIIAIIETEFGLPYARRFRDNAPCE